MKNIDIRTLKKVSCWENRLGYEFYKLFIFDWAVSIVVNTIVFEFFASGISKCLNRSPPRFDISANSVDIIFGSAISLVGYYFTPLLCALSCLRLAVMFYVKWLSVSMVCDVPKFVLNLGSVSVTQIIGQSISYFFSLLFLVTFILPTPTSDNCGPFGMVQNF